MKDKLKKLIISFALMILVNLTLSSSFFWELGIETPHVGMLYVLGLLFGPYGALGAVSANIILDFVNGFTPIEILPSAIFSFGVSYLAYKLWYSGYKTSKFTKPTLDNTYHIILFLSSILLCGLIYAVIHGNLVDILIDEDLVTYEILSYFLNFINFAFIFGIICIWIFNKTDLIETPKTSKKQANKRLYRILFILVVILTAIMSISLIVKIDDNIIIGEIVLTGIFLFAYLTKPFENEIEKNNDNTITKKIMQTFLRITLCIAILGIIVSILSYLSISNINNTNFLIYLMPLIVTDVIITLFFIPEIFILRYIEQKVIKPISSFSEIENFIKENEKIETEGLVNIYSKYINEKTEIGTLARSYTELINHNNEYIENINEIEGEKERIKAELEIAEKIQAANLPTDAIENDDFTVDGYSHPAKEVGGDFFDYYMLDDDNLAIVIGDASGKGVPAAILAMITQVMTKQILNHDQEPSKVLSLLNNQLCENNTENMFLTLWLGIYNKTTKKLTFSNAGHTPPMIKENGEFRYMDIDAGIVLGVMEDFEYIDHEISLTEEFVVYTDGITDANNSHDEMYGEDRLLSFFNEFKSDTDPISPLLDDIKNFTQEQEQFDDMTIVYLRMN